MRNRNDKRIGSHQYMESWYLVAENGGRIVGLITGQGIIVSVC